MKTLSMAILASLSFGLSKTWGSGLVMKKEQSYHSDESATLVVFLEMVDNGAPFIKFKTTRGDVIIDKAKIGGMVEIPDSIPATITKEEEIAPLRNACKKIEDFSNKYSKSKALLADSLQKLKTVTERYDGGEIRYNGKWITKNEYLNIQSRISEKMASIEAEDKKTEEEKQLAENQRLEYEKSQRSKGLVKYNNQWMPVAEAQSLEDQDRQKFADAQRAAFELTQQQKAIELQQRVEELRIEGAEREAKKVAVSEQQDEAESRRIAAEIAEQDAAKAGNINAQLRQARKGQAGVDPKLQTRARSGDPYAQIEINAQLELNRVNQDLAAARITKQEASAERARIQAGMQQEKLMIDQEQMIHEQRRTTDELNRIRTEMERRRYQRR